MTNKTGIISNCFDNRTYQNQPSKYPSWKVMMGDEEFVCYTNLDIEVKQGDSISIEYDISKKTGKKFILSNSATKMPMIQVMPQDGTAPTDDIPLPDDDLNNFEPDPFGSNGVVDKNPTTNFNYGANMSKTVDKKSMQIFSIAMTKSALESNQLKADKVSIQNFIKEMKTIFESEF